MQFLTLFLFFANNSRMEGPIPVFLTYLDLPNGLEGGSTANYFFWIFMLNKVCTAKREAIVKPCNFMAMHGGPWRNIPFYQYFKAYII